MVCLRIAFLILLLLGAHLDAMKREIAATVDLLTVLPEDILYIIINKWPALNVYSKICKHFYSLTSYEHADSIISKLGPSSLGKWDAQKLLSKYRRQGDTERANILCARLGKDVQKIHEAYKGQSPLAQAAFHGNLEKIATEYAILVDTNPPDMHCIIQDALINTLINDRALVTLFLLESLSEKDALKINWLHEAARKAHINTMSLLLNKLAIARIQLYIKSLNENSLTPCMCAILFGRLAIAQLLWCHGASISESNIEYGLPLYDPCEQGRGEIVEFLLSHDIDPDSVYNKHTENSTYRAHREDVTPLYATATHNYIEIAQKLIAAGANVNHGSRDNDSIMPVPTPLIQAAREGHLPMVQLLVAAGAWIFAPQYEGKNALETARAQGHTHIVQWLEKNGYKA